MKHIFSSIPSPEINDLQLGFFTVRYYALFIIIGIVIAISVSALRLKNRGGSAGAAVDIAIWTVPFGIVGARLYHVVTHLNDYFGPGIDPLTVFYIWNGGLAIFGGLIFGALGAWLGARQAGIKFFAYADAVVPGLLIAQAIGRLGNYFNNELFGVPTTLPWGLEIDPGNSAYPAGLPQGVLFHPTFLYEMIWSLVGVAVILFAEKKLMLQWGKVFACYLIFYSFGRIFIESIRIDPAYVFIGLRTNVWSAIIGVIAGVFLFYLQSRKHTGLEETVYLPNREPAVVETDSDDTERLMAEAK